MPAENEPISDRRAWGRCCFLQRPLLVASHVAGRCRQSIRGSSFRVRRSTLGAFALLTAACAGAASFEACHPTEGQSGVHVSIDLDPSSGWQSSDAFDHIIVTATSGSHVAVVCFSTQQSETTRHLIVDAGGPTADPCADQTVFSWSSLPTVTTWQLDQTARTVNFEFPEGDRVHVVAEAHLGGSAAKGQASGDATSEIGASDLSLHIMKNSSSDECPVILGQTLVSDAGTSKLADCNATPVTCLDDCIRGTRNDTCLGRSTATECDDAGTVVVDTLGYDAGCATDRVSRGTAAGSCVQIALHGHFFRCLEGDIRTVANCTQTADCNVPDAGMEFTPIGTAAPVTIPLSCVPPFVFPVDMLVQSPDSIAAVGAVALDIPTTNDPKACVFAYEAAVIGACPH